MTEQLESTAITKKPYSEEFKREAVELLRTSGRPLAQIARELGVSADSLRLWRQQAETNGAERGGLPSEEREEPRRLRNSMFERKRIWVSLVVVGAAAAAAVVFLLVTVAGGDGDDGPAADTPGQAAKAEQPVEGSFVGEVSGTEAFVAVVAEPSNGNQNRQVQVYITDGSGLSEWFSGSISDNSFAVPSDDGDGEVKGKLSRDSVAGTVELPDGEAARYEANRPTGAAGLYDLTMSRRGKLTGASAGGLGLRGTIKLPEGTGTLRLADGKRLKLTVTEDPAADLPRLGAGQVRLIILPDGAVSGAGKGRPSGGTGDSFFVRSRP